MWSVKRGGKGKGMKPDYNILLCSNAFWQEVTMSGTNVMHGPVCSGRGLESVMGANGNLLN